MKKKLFIILTISMYTFTLFSCGNKSDYEGFTIDKKNALEYKIHRTNKDSTAVSENMLVVYHVIFRTINDSVFYDSRNSMDETVPVLIEKPYHKGDMFASLLKLRAGDSATFVYNVDSFFLYQNQMIHPSVINDEVFFVDYIVLSVRDKTEVERERIADQKKEEQISDDRLLSYIKSKKITQKPSSSGYYLIEEREGKGKSPEKGMYALIYFSCSLLDEIPVFSTFEKNKPQPYEVGSGSNGTGFELALKKLKEGSKAKIIIPYYLAWPKGLPQYNIPSYSNVIFEVEIFELFKKEDYEKMVMDEVEKRKKAETPLLNKYLKKNTISQTQEKSGIYYIPNKEGKGELVQTGDLLKVIYKGSLINGSVFEPLDTIVFRLGSDKMLIGWEEAMLKMKKGGKAKIIIPSEVGFGGIPQTDDNGDIAIPAYSTIIFDVELFDIQ